jgi:hypothetical protein
MEIRIRPILAIIVTAAVAAAGGLFVIPRLTQLASSRSGAPVIPTAGASNTALPVGSSVVTYVDESLGWDWQVSCGPQFQRFLVEKLAGQPIRAVKVVLVDNTPERKLPFGVRYPDAQGPKTSGNCYNEQGRYTCFMAVAEGEPGADLDVAATLNAPYTLLDMFLARGADPGAIRQTWRWATFQPLITPAQEGANQWQSACLQLSRVR